MTYEANGRMITRGGKPFCNILQADWTRALPGIDYDPVEMTRFAEAVPPALEGSRMALELLTRAEVKKVIVDSGASVSLYKALETLNRALV